MSLDFPHVADIEPTIQWFNLEVIEAETFAPAAGGGEYYHAAVENISKTGANQLTVDSRWLAKWPVGTAFRIRQYQYEKHAFYITHTSHLKFEKVTR